MYCCGGTEATISRAKDALFLQELETCLQFQISKGKEDNCTERINDELRKTGVGALWELGE
jgi:hypothetical protein